jgi:hypothetical protein
VPKGTLRLIDPTTGEICRFTEKPVNWNTSGVAGVYAVAGQVTEDIDGPIPADSPNWQFVATTAQVTITNTQSILANITAGLGECSFIGNGVHPDQPSCIVPEAKPGAKPNIDPPFNEFGYGVCFQQAVGGQEEYPVVNMNQFTDGNNSNYTAASYEVGEQDYTGIGTAPGAGTYNVGYCVQNYGDETLDNNNWANGYVEVVDGLPNTGGVSQDTSRQGD